MSDVNFRKKMTIFTKPYRVKSNTQMKGSDKKKLKAALKKTFPLLTDDQLNELLPMKEKCCNQLFDNEKKTLGHNMVFVK